MFVASETSAVHARWQVAAWACACAFLVHTALGLIAHFSLRTNAFDLSVFDYALWTTASGERLAFVPMFGHSLFAQHFMPTLLLLAPMPLVIGSPVYLIVLQTLLHAAAGFLLFRFAQRRVSQPMALALLAAFLLSRRANVALNSYFYIESAEPLLVFGALLAWSSARQRVYWLLAILALGCKEDVAIYFLTFGTMLAVTRLDRPTGLKTVAVAGVWLAVAVFVAIPYWRSFDALPAANPFVEERYALASGGVSAMATRLLSLQSLKVLLGVTGTTGFLCLLSPAWLAVALPGIALNLASVPGAGQSDLHGHYLWPILPWLFIAAVFGAQRLSIASGRWLAAAIALVTVFDAPLPRSIAGAPWKKLPEAAHVRSQLHALTPSGDVVAQPNLLPHLQRQMHVWGFGYTAQPDGDYVLLTRVGDGWPLDADAVTREISRFQADARYEQIADGPLYAFRRR